MTDAKKSWFGRRLGWCVRHGPLVVGVVTFAVSLAHIVAGGRLSEPPEMGDGHDYDAIALNLARGRGFGFFWSDPEWREPYEAAMARGNPAYADLLRRHSPFALTAYRPPGLPAMLAVVYATVGRHFALWRILNALFLALAAAVTCVIGRRLVSPSVGLLAGLFFAFEPTYRFFVGQYMTEVLAVLAVTLVVWSLVALAERPTRARFALAGLVMGAAILVRSIFVLYIPFAYGVGLWAARRQGRRLTARWLVMVATGLVVFAPWGIRNCLTLGAFMPVGVHGWTNLPAGYSDEAVRTQGNWSYSFITALHNNARGPEASDTVGPEAERRAAIVGRQYAWDWVKANPLSVLGLFVAKAKLHWRPDTYDMVLYAFAVLGVILLRFGRFAGILYLVLVTNTVAVGLTWSTSGRFRVPIMPVVQVLAAVGVLYPRGRGMKDEG